MKNSKIIKIIVPVIMIIIVAGIWLVQNDEQPKGENNNVTNETTAPNDENSEYPLVVTSVDIQELTEHNLPMIIDFGADASVPCKEMAPVLVELNQEMQGKAIIQFVDVWKNPEAATNFPVQVIPTQILFNADGTPYVPSEETREYIQFTMYADSNTEEHIYTVHQGGLTKIQMERILRDMGVNIE